ALMDRVDAARDADPLLLARGLEVGELLRVESTAVARDLENERLALGVDAFLRAAVLDQSLDEWADLDEGLVGPRRCEVTRHRAPMIGPSWSPVNESRNGGPLRRLRSSSGRGSRSGS